MPGAAGSKALLNILRQAAALPEEDPRQQLRLRRGQVLFDYGNHAAAQGNGRSSQAAGSAAAKQADLERVGVDEAVNPLRAEIKGVVKATGHAPSFRLDDGAAQAQPFSEAVELPRIAVDLDQEPAGDSAAPFRRLHRLHLQHVSAVIAVVQRLLRDCPLHIKGRAGIIEQPVTRRGRVKSHKKGGRPGGYRYQH